VTRLTKAISRSLHQPKVEKGSPVAVQYRGRGLSRSVRKRYGVRSMSAQVAYFSNPAGCFSEIRGLPPAVKKRS
jgi:hypothetical protein